VLVGVDGDLQLGAHAIIGGNQNGILKASRFQIEEAAKTADFAIRTGAARRTDERLDLFNHQVSGIDIDTCLRIGQAIVAGELVFRGHGLLLKLGAIHLRAMTRDGFARKVKKREKRKTPLESAQFFAGPVMSASI
jgi:hypothetical protein